MCGICGILSDSPETEEKVQAMTRVLAHRGPDGDGVTRVGQVALGHRRLSVIDLENGQQPMSTEDGNVIITFNGEIYNFRQLKRDLTSRGYRFRTNSDTETILNLYLEHGVDCVKHLRGMFAFAIWDSRIERIFAARDRLGQKPFYYVQRNKEFSFASEIKALLAVDDSLRKINLTALDEYLTIRLISPPNSMFDGVRKLPPAHYLTFDDRKGLEIKRYWSLNYEPKLTGSDSDLLDELEERLVECIKFHLVSDVPVGAFMSGGLDSTLIVALLMKYGLAEDLQTFSVGLPYGEYDEAPAARLVAQRYSTRHHEEQINPSLLASLPRIVHQLDEPSDPLAVCMDLVAKMARQHVKVVLGGDGGDELFGGYDRYYGNYYAGYYARIPEVLRNGILGPLIRLIPDGRWYKSVGHQIKWIDRLAAYSGGERYAQSLAYFYVNSSLKERIYGPTMRGWQSQFDPAALIRDSFDAAPAKDALDRMLYADCQTRLPDHPVMIQDRMTMAHGLEARSPFMDHELAEFTARLPRRLKIRGRKLRFIQTQLAKRHLPEPVLRRKKQGFSSALPYMLKDELDSLYDLFLQNMTMAGEGLVDQAGVRQLVVEHRTGQVDHGNRLWLLVNSEIWYRMFIVGHTQEELECYVQAG